MEKLIYIFVPEMKWRNRRKRKEYDDLNSFKDEEMIDQCAEAYKQAGYKIPE